MALIVLKCPVCSGTIEADGSNEFAACPFCGAQVKIPGRNKIIIETVNKSDETRYQNYSGLANQAYASRSYAEAERYYGKALQYRSDDFLLFRHGLCHIHQTRGVEGGWQGLKLYLDQQTEADLEVHRQISTELCQLADSIGPPSKPPINTIHKAENYEKQLFQAAQTFGELFPYIYGDLCDPVEYGRFLEYAKAYAGRLIANSIVWTDPATKKEGSYSIPMDHQRIANTYFNQYKNAIHYNNRALLRLKQSRVEELVRRLKELPVSKWILYYFATKWTFAIPGLIYLLAGYPVFAYSCFFHLACAVIFQQNSDRKDINYMLRDTFETCKEILILRWNT